MIFSRFALAEAEGTILAHAVKVSDGVIGKGTILGPADIARLAAASIAEVIALKPGAGDYPENEAAAIIASALEMRGLNLSLTPAHTGRVNLHAVGNGLFTANRTVIDRLNRIHPAVTIACLADHVPVMAGEMVATLKIIPLAVERWVVERWTQCILDYQPFQVKPFHAATVHLVSTELPALKPSVIDKTAQVLENRLAPSGSRLASHRRVAHSAAAVCDAMLAAIAAPDEQPRMIVVFGASAMADFDDIIPAAIRQAGGTVIHAGMPVDPGNLLVLGDIDGTPVIGAPGCARSPKENGFDWILNRLLAGEQPDAALITGMGVGGLLKEIVTRPTPRAATAGEGGAVRLTTVVLAAGQARRMGSGGPHKLLAEFSGVPLVARTVATARAAPVGAVVVVTGHRQGDIAAALADQDVTLVHNPLYENGMSTSLACGVAHEAVQGADGVLVLLADMPGITPDNLAALAGAFAASGGHAIIRATANGKRGNPVILPRETYQAVLRLEGDTGARAIIETSGLPVIDVEIGAAAHLDVDTPEAVVAAGGQLRG